MKLEGGMLGEYEESLRWGIRNRYDLILLYTCTRISKIGKGFKEKLNWKVYFLLHIGCRPLRPWCDHGAEGTELHRLEVATHKASFLSLAGNGEEAGLQ